MDAVLSPLRQLDLNAAVAVTPQKKAEVERQEVVEEAVEENALTALLRLCGQTVCASSLDSIYAQQVMVAHTQTRVEELPSMDALLQQHTNVEGVRKIGEGTFGEAYKGGGVVFKIVPMEGETLVNGEAQKRAGEIMAEALIALRLSGLRAGQQPQGVPSHRIEGPTTWCTACYNLL